MAGTATVRAAAKDGALDLPDPRADPRHERTYEPTSA
jgi:hypothetical protein